MIKKTFENEINSFTKQIKSLQKEQKREYRNLKISNKMKDTRYYYFKIIIKRYHTFTPKKNLGLDFGYETQNPNPKSNNFGYETQSKIQILFSFFELINVFFKYSILRWILDKMKEFEKDSFKNERIYSKMKEFVKISLNFKENIKNILLRIKNSSQNKIFKRKNI